MNKMQKIVGASVVGAMILAPVGAAHATMTGWNIENFYSMPLIVTRIGYNDDYFGLVLREKATYLNMVILDPRFEEEYANFLYEKMGQERVRWGKNLYNGDLSDFVVNEEKIVTLEDGVRFTNDRQGLIFYSLSFEDGSHFEGKISYKPCKAAFDNGEYDGENYECRVYYNEGIMELKAGENGEIYMSAYTAAKYNSEDNTIATWYDYKPELKSAEMVGLPSGVKTAEQVEEERLEAAEAAAERAALEEALQTLTEQQSENLAEIDRLRNELSEKENASVTEINNLNGEIRDLESENDGLRSEISDLKQRIDELDAEANNLESEIEELEAKVESLGSENDRLGSENGNLKSENSYLESENSHLESENSRLESENGELKSANGQLETENNKLGSKNDDLELEISDLITEIEKLETESEDLEAKIEEYKVTLAAEMKKWQDELAEKEATINALKTQLGEAEREKAEEVNRLEAELMELNTAKLAETEALAQKLSEAEKARITEKETLMAKIAELELKLAAAESATAQTRTVYVDREVVKEVPVEKDCEVALTDAYNTESNNETKEEVTPELNRGMDKPWWILLPIGAVVCGLAYWWLSTETKLKKKK